MQATTELLAEAHPGATPLAARTNQTRVHRPPARSLRFEAVLCTPPHARALLVRLFELECVRASATP